MGDKVIITDVLEASKLTDTYSSLTAKSIIKQLKSGNSESSSVRYEGLDDDIEITNSTKPNDYESANTTSNKDSFTVTDAIEYLGFGKFQIKLSFLTGLVLAADAMEMMILSIVPTALACEWKITKQQESLIPTIVFGGMMLSSTFWGKICDKFGRRTGLMLSALLTFSMGALSSLAPSFWSFIFLRLLTGLGMGGIPQSITLYAEFLPMAHRARSVIIIESFWGIGSIFESLLALGVMSTWNLGWRWLLIFSSLPLLIFSIACFWLPESVRYLMASGNIDAAHDTLKRIAKENNKTLPIGKIADISTSNGTQRGDLRILLTGEYRKTTLLLWTIWMVNAFSYYGIVMFTTEILKTHDTCRGFSPDEACVPLTQGDYTAILVTSLAEIVALFISITTIEWLGRKVSMAMEFGVFAIFTFMLYFCLGYPWIVSFLFIARAFIGAAFQCAYVYTPEVYPTTLRAIGLGASSGMARIGAIVSPYVAIYLSYHGLFLPISIYGLAAIVGVIASLSLPIETTGRQIRETH